MKLSEIGQRASISLIDCTEEELARFSAEPAPDSTRVHDTFDLERDGSAVQRLDVGTPTFAPHRPHPPEAGKFEQACEVPSPSAPSQLTPRQEAARRAIVSGCKERIIKGGWVPSLWTVIIRSQCGLSLGEKSAFTDAANSAGITLFGAGTAPGHLHSLEWVFDDLKVDGTPISADKVEQVVFMLRTFEHEWKRINELRWLRTKLPEKIENRTNELKRTLSGKPERYQQAWIAADQKLLNMRAALDKANDAWDLYA